MSARRVAQFFAVAILVGGCTTDGGLVPEPPKAPSGGEPLLAPIDQLKTDTTEASLFDWRSAGIPYVGVWAAEPAGCARIDVDASYPTFAVVTVKTLRQGTLNCAIAAKPGTEPVDGVTVRFTNPSRSMPLRVKVSIRCEIVPMTRLISLKRRGPSRSAMTISTLHLSPTRARM